jgi:protease IV
MSKRINSYLKTVFFIIIIMQITPPIVKNLLKYLETSTNPKNKIGYIVINEAIYSSTEYIKQLHGFFKDSEIKAIILKLDSPGGAAGSSQALMQEIESLKSQHPKPIVTYIENICVSGAYYVASATDQIIATGSAVVGSIGSKIRTQFNVKKLLEKYDVTTETISSGTHKMILDPFSDMTPEHRQCLQDLSNDTYKQFVADIAERRHLPIETSSDWAEGKLFTGKQAYELKLVDKIGNLSTAIEFIKKHIIPGSRPVVLVNVPQKNVVQKWFQQSDESFDADIEQSVANKLFNKFVQYLETPKINSL